MKLLQINTLFLIFFSIGLSAQASDVRCEHLLFSEEVIEERLKTLAQTKIKIDHRDFSTPELLERTRTQFQEDLSQMIRLYPKTHKRFLSLLKTEDKSHVQESAKNREEKAAKINSADMENILRKILLIKNDDSFSSNLLNYFARFEFDIRWKLSDFILNEWSKENYSEAQRNFSFHYKVLFFKMARSEDVLMWKKMMDLNMFGVNSFDALSLSAHYEFKGGFDLAIRQPEVDLNVKLENAQKSALHVAAEKDWKKAFDYILSQPQVTKDPEALKLAKAKGWL